MCFKAGFYIYIKFYFFSPIKFCCSSFLDSLCLLFQLFPFQVFKMALCIHLNIGELLALSGEISISEGFFYSLVGQGTEN